MAAARGRLRLGHPARGHRLGTRRRSPPTPAIPPTPRTTSRRADAAIVDATSRGLRVLASFTGAPRWAEGAGRPASADPGSWKPDPAALEGYGAALARRYDGTRSRTRPGPGRTLPRVAAFQPWNEPNLDKYLAPQWSGGKTFAPAHYRRMLTAFTNGVKSVRASAVVVSGGTAPFGDPFPNGHRIMPARFVREMLCLRRSKGRLLKTASCPSPARFDVLAHHPYSVGEPTRKALNDDDVSIPDIGKLTRLLRAAERTGGALPRKRHRVWATEVSYDSSPPDPQGIPAAQHARYLEQAFYLLWKQGVDTITWFQIRDQLPNPSYAATNPVGDLLRRRPREGRAARVSLPARRRARRRARRCASGGGRPSRGSVRIERRAGSSLAARADRARDAPRHVRRADRGARPDERARARRQRDKPCLAYQPEDLVDRAGRAGARCSSQFGKPGGGARSSLKGVAVRRVLILTLSLSLTTALMFASAGSAQAPSIVRGFTVQVTLTVTPKRDRTRPYTFTSRGRVVPPARLCYPGQNPTPGAGNCVPILCPAGVTDPRYCLIPGARSVCSGRVTVRIRRSRRRSRRAPSLSGPIARTAAK